MNGMSLTEWSVDQEKNQKEVQISKGEKFNPVISVDNSEGRFVLQFLDPATLEDPSKECVVWCRRQHRTSHFTVDTKWGLFIKMATGCEIQRWGTLADPRPGRGHGDEWNDCVGSMSASPRPVDDHLFLSKSVPVIPRYGHQMYSVFLWEMWLEKQAERNH